MNKTLLAGVAGLALLVAACGGDDTTDPVADPVVTTAADPAPTTADTESAATTVADTEPAPTTEAAAPGTTTGEMPDEAAYPQAIISLSPTATEMLYAVGAGDQVLAVDDFSNFPEEAMSKMQGISGWEPNVEAIAGLGPDLVITDGTNPDFLTQLDTIGIPHWEGYAATTFEDVYAQIEEIGAATGHADEAAALTAQMRAEVDEIKAGLPALDEPLTYYHELDDTYFSVTSDTFIGAVYDEIGLVNIADAVGDGNPYPQLSVEFIFEQDPDLIFLACTKYCGESADTVAARDGWDVLSAVQNGGVIEMDDDIASRWGPRVVEYLRAAGDAVAAVAALQPAA